jgi:hypothetical protein
MEAMVSCNLSADATTEIRRKVHKSRADSPLVTKEAIDREIISHDVRVIEEDFVLLFNLRVQPEPWPDINSWEYPGPWVNPISESLIRILDGEDSVYIFSKSGSFHLKIVKIQ